MRQRLFFAFVIVQNYTVTIMGKNCMTVLLKFLLKYHFDVSDGLTAKIY